MNGLPSFRQSSTKQTPVDYVPRQKYKAADIKKNTFSPSIRLWILFYLASNAFAISECECAWRGCVFTAYRRSVLCYFVLFFLLQFHLIQFVKLFQNTFSVIFKNITLVTSVNKTNILLSTQEIVLKTSRLDPLPKISIVISFSSSFFLSRKTVGVERRLRG